MQDGVSIALIVVLSVVSLVLAGVGIYLVLVLREVRKTMQKVNSALDGTQAKFQAIVRPLEHIGTSLQGLKTGMRVVDTFMQWLSRESKD